MTGLWSVVTAFALIAAGGCAVESTAIVPDGAPARDSGTDTGATCNVTPEECNGRDDDCDGSVDEDFDLQTSIRHCGECRNACPADPRNGDYVCEAGSCVSRCDPSFGDCDDDLSDGCETTLLTSSNCGACGTVCEPPTPYCADAACVSMCAPPRTVCPDGGCVDTSDDVTNCGACGTVCPGAANARATCSGGVCGFACRSGFDDCDGNSTNGCEASLDAADTCGECGMACRRTGATGACVSRMCQYTCSAGRGDCDGNAINGCEQVLTTTEHCGACDVPCAITGGTSSCVTGTCEISSCGAGRADCDRMTANGCEADLAAPATCGACGVSCGGGESCTDGFCCPSGWTCETGCGMGSECVCSSSDECAYLCPGYCDVRCQDNNTECTVTASMGDAALHCQSGADCTFDARGGGDVTMTCQNNSTTCTVDCRGTTSCEVACNSSAECEIQCDPGDASCRFTSCSTVSDCGGGLFRCGFGC